MTSEFWTASYILLWLLVVALAVILMGMLRQLGLIQLRLGVDPGVLITREGLERGAEAPDFEAIDVHTRRATRLADLRGRRVALVLLTPSCLACRQLVPHLNEVARVHGQEVEVVAVCSSTGAACQEFVRQFKVQTRLLLDPAGAMALRYQVNATPFAFLIDEYGTVLIRGVVNSWPQLEALLKEEGTFQTSSWQQIPGHPEGPVRETAGHAARAPAPDGAVSAESGRRS